MGYTKGNDGLLIQNNKAPVLI